MNRTETQKGSDIGGATKGSAPQSIVDVYVYSAAFPGNFWHTLHELSEIYEQRRDLHLDGKDMLRLKLLAVLLTEQLLGQLSVNSPKVLGLMREYDSLKVSENEE